MGSHRMVLLPVGYAARSDEAVSNSLHFEEAVLGAQGVQLGKQPIQQEAHLPRAAETQNPASRSLAT